MITTLNLDTRGEFRNPSDVDDSVHIVCEKVLSQSESSSLGAFIAQFALDYLDAEYVEENVDDGDQKIFIIERGSARKEILASNKFQEDFAKLGDHVNALLGQHHRIVYRELYED